MRNWGGIGTEKWGLRGYLSGVPGVGDCLTAEQSWTNRVRPADLPRVLPLPIDLRACVGASGHQRPVERPRVPDLCGSDVAYLPWLL